MNDSPLTDPAYAVPGEPLNHSSFLKEHAWKNLYEAKESLTEAYADLYCTDDTGLCSYVKSIIEEVKVAMLEIQS